MGWAVGDRNACTARSRRAGDGRRRRVRGDARCARRCAAGPPGAAAASHARRLRLDRRRRIQPPRSPAGNRPLTTGARRGSPLRIPASRNAKRGDRCDAGEKSRRMRRPGPARLLMVDDNEQFLVAARALLEREGLHVVGVASTSAEARELASELRPDCVLVDVDLGVESGFDVAARLVAEGSYSVVLISAYPEAEFSDLLVGSPAIGFISKAELSAQRIADLLEAQIE